MFITTRFGVPPLGGSASGVSRNSFRNAFATSHVFAVLSLTHASVNREFATTPIVRRNARLSSNDAHQ